MVHAYALALRCGVALLLGRGSVGDKSRLPRNLTLATFFSRSAQGPGALCESGSLSRTVVQTDKSGTKRIGHLDSEEGPPALEISPHALDLFQRRVLLIPHGPVDPIPSQQLVVSTLLRDSPILEDDNEVRIRNRLQPARKSVMLHARRRRDEPMSNKYARALLGEQRRVDIPHQVRLGRRIERRSLFKSHQLPLTRTTAEAELTASSKNKILGSFNRSLATASLCFSPPLIINPLSPTLVNHLSGKLSIVLETFANLAASLTSSSVALNLPYRTFSSTFEWKSGVSCGTTPIVRLKLSTWTSRRSCPSIEMVPFVGS